MQPSTVFIALGANLGDPTRQCQEAVNRLKKIKGSSIQKVSSFYKTEPLVRPDQNAQEVPWYVNAVCKGTTSLNPLEFFEELKKIEEAMGRTRTRKWESRLIDLDLLFYDDRILDEKDLRLPHPELHRRRFVLEPLKEIAPDWVHPVLKKTVGELAEEIKSSGVIEKIS